MSLVTYGVDSLVVGEVSQRPEKERKLPPLAVNSQQARELEILAKQGNQRLRKLSTHLTSLQATPMTPRELRLEVEKVVDSADAEVIAQQLFRLGLACRRRKRSPAVVLDALTRGLQRIEWDESQRQQWENNKPALEQLLSVPSLRVLVKAVDMSYDYSNLLDSARILVDIRPVLDVDQTRLEGAIVSHVLRIEYVNEEGPHSLSILLDDSDVDRLQEACQEATVKARVIRKFVETAGARTIGPGGDDERG